ncbi:hypothetical protein [Micromonospora sp. NBC_01796]|uniref:hypothetical protein n=1 Tax=Micromonospora sp. NBC_01796 TaxID=2975987 RepID=UPI002DD8DDF3|nr:hypothetical protein [Micromonospora sp. NBC_01796]WSA84315.1 hypothetical protein OIE47_28735 [Micromonospora sp. NBC_01796]
MRDGFLLFPFSPADQGRIDPTSISVTDIGYAPAPVAGQPYPQAMRLAFRLTAGSPVPQVRPLFPGQLRFVADPAAPGVIPAPDDVEFTETAYAGWRTIGMLRLTVDPEAARALGELDPDLAVLPNVVWYGPVRISQEFLFSTLRTGLRAERLGGTPSIPPSDPRWAKHAVAAFLDGRYEPTIRAGATAATDDRIAHPMPTVHPTGAQHDVTLLVTAATRQSPKDGPRERFNVLSAGVDEDDPAHSANGAVPARHVYRVLRQHLTDAATGTAVPDAVLATGGSAPVYHALRCTRTWQPVAECSVHFPAQRISVADPAGNPLAVQRLPAHGVFFWSYPADAPVRDLRVSVAGGMRWIDGGTADVWRQPAATVALAYDLAATPSPHLQLRLPMGEAMLTEPRDAPGGGRCTYMSMRRSVRALTDNRVCGGRLNFGRGVTGPGTRQLMDDAWAGTPAHAGILRNNQPLPNLSPDVGAPRLVPVLRAFFPDEVPAQNIGGSTHRATAYDGGEMAYRLWQTIIGSFHAEGTKRNFPPTVIGRGGPGVLVATGLAAGFQLDPVRRPGETDSVYFDRVVGLATAGIRPGALLQFWNLDTDFEGIKATQTSANAHPMDSYGHSLVFVGYDRDGTGAVTGLITIDQFGEGIRTIGGAAGSRLIEWGGADQQIWVAANWAE